MIYQNFLTAKEYTFSNTKQSLILKIQTNLKADVGKFFPKNKLANHNILISPQLIISSR